MKKFLTFGTTLLMLLLFMSTHVYSGSKCCASQASAKTSCHSIKATVTTGESGSATAMIHEKCAKICGMTPEQCAKICGGHGNCACIRMSVEGMTGPDSDKIIKAALEDIPGVFKVMKTDHKEGLVLVCTDPAKVKKETLTRAITSKGYKAKITASGDKANNPKETSQVTTGSHPCGPAAAKACAASKKTCSHSKKGCAATKAKQTSSKSSD